MTMKMIVTLIIKKILKPSHTVIHFKNSKSLAQHSRSNKKNIKQRKVVIIGDSMIKGVKPWSIRKSLKQNIQLKSFAGAKLDDMEHYIIPSKKARC